MLAGDDDCEPQSLGLCRVKERTINEQLMVVVVVASDIDLSNFEVNKEGKKFSYSKAQIYSRSSATDD